MCFLSQPLNLFSLITSFCTDDAGFADAPPLRGVLPVSAVFFCRFFKKKKSESENMCNMFGQKVQMKQDALSRIRENTTKILKWEAVD